MSKFTINIADAQGKEHSVELSKEEFDLNDKVEWALRGLKTQLDLGYDDVLTREAPTITKMYELVDLLPDVLKEAQISHMKAAGFERSA